MKDISKKNPTNNTGHKQRLDSFLVQNGYATSRTVAHTLIDSGLVTVDEVVVLKRNRIVKFGDDVKVKPAQTFVGRGAEKLHYAFDVNNMIVNPGSVALDIGSSTGDFTDALLQLGVDKVYAVDVGTDQLDKRLLANTKVVSMEGVDIRNIDELYEKVQIIVCDVSFVSLRHIIPVLKKFHGEVVDIFLLVKPQFEVGRQLLGKKGVVKDKSIQLLSLLDITSFAEEEGYRVVSAVESFPRGKTGNLEYVLYLKCI